MPPYANDVQYSTVYANANTHAQTHVHKRAWNYKLTRKRIKIEKRIVVFKAATPLQDIYVFSQVF